MDNTLLDFGFIHIRWYSICIFVGMLVAIFLIKKEAKKKNIQDDYLIDLMFYGIIGGIIGARIYYVLFNLNYYLTNPKEIIMIWNGGLAIHGGIIASLIFFYFYSKKKKKNLLLTLDLFSVGLIIAQAIGRWGNFFNQEAYGRIISKKILLKMHLPKFIINGMYINGFYREPTFLYESLFSFIGFITLLIIRKNKNIKTGFLTSIYLIWYGLERMVIESLRSDSLMLGPIKVAQFVSLIAIISGVIIIIKSKKNNNYHQDKIDIDNRREKCIRR